MVQYQVKKKLKTLMHEKEFLMPLKIIYFQWKLYMTMLVKNLHQLHQKIRTRKPTQGIGLKKLTLRKCFKVY